MIYMSAICVIASIWTFFNSDDIFIDVMSVFSLVFNFIFIFQQIQKGLF